MSRLTRPIKKGSGRKARRDSSVTRAARAAMAFLALCACATADASPAKVEFNNTSVVKTAPFKEAVEDLQAVGLWVPLTEELYLVKFAVYDRPTPSQSEHLANALPTYVQDEAGEIQPACDIVIYRTSIAEWTSQQFDRFAPEQDVDPQISRRLIYGAVVAHELAHCLDGGSNEDTAEEWGIRAFRAIRDLIR